MKKLTLIETNKIVYTRGASFICAPYNGVVNTSLCWYSFKTLGLVLSDHEPYAHEGITSIYDIHITQPKQSWEEAVWKEYEPLSYHKTW